LTDAGIYVHVPFCITRCGYCDFNAYAGLDELKPRYLRALLGEAELAAPGWDGTPFVSVFLGGGTPTTMAPADLRALLVHLRDRFALADDAEVTSRRTPTRRRASLRRSATPGYDRLSMGAQSFDPAVLASLERIHQPASVRARSRRARGRLRQRQPRPDLRADGETLESWERTLRETIALAPEHVSAYALTIEPATALGRRSRRATPGADPDMQADMFSARVHAAGDAGYRHYEVSNWAKPGFECRHNLGYWERRPYVGLGAGAHAYRDDVRWWNLRPPEAYMERVERGELPIGGRSRSIRPTPTWKRCSSSCGSSRAFPPAGSSRGATSRSSRAAARRRLRTARPTERGMLLLNELVLGLTGVAAAARPVQLAACRRSRAPNCHTRQDAATPTGTRVSRAERRGCSRRARTVRPVPHAPGTTRGPVRSAATRTAPR
jgi:oxygen-independent coproporphyrinogen-3 oxidase